MATLVLPEDAIFQIMIWLPVQSLLRFKSVCTSWYSLIKSSHFIQNHVTNTNTMVDKNSKLGNTFICQHETVPVPTFRLLSDQGFTELEDLGIHPYFKNVRELSDIDMVDSVHGIICMYNRITWDIVLWNPATRKSRLLPKSSNGNPKDRSFVGLFFDVETKDYKVIQVSSLESQHTTLPKVQIYSLSTDSWRLVDSDFPTGTVHCFSPPAGRSLNGIFFHLGLEYIKDQPFTFTDVILSFNLRKEKYQRVLQIPDDNIPKLESIGDKLACITTPRGFTMPRDGKCSGSYIKVWMLNDYDNMVKDLWTELYRVDVTSPKIYPRCPYIVAVLSNGTSGLFVGETVGLYNLITHEFEDLGFGEGMRLYTMMPAIYKESLVSVDAVAKTISS